MTNSETHVLRVSPSATLVRASNAGPMTLEGTNTWVLRAPGSSEVVVLDPGPLDERHLAAVLEEATRDGGEVQLVVYSHWHPDHTESIDRFLELTQAPARAVDEKWCRNADPLSDGEQLHVGGLGVTVLATPGHTLDSICLLIENEQTLLTADTILGRGTTVVAHPDGELRAYLQSLQGIKQLISSGSVQQILPGHGPVIDRPMQAVDAYLQHREDRLKQVREAVAAGDTTAAAVVARVYADVDESLKWAAEMSVRAQLDYLGVGG